MALDSLNDLTNRSSAHSRSTARSSAHTRPGSRKSKSRSRPLYRSEQAQFSVRGFRDERSSRSSFQDRLSNKFRTSVRLNAKIPRTFSSGPISRSRAHLFPRPSRRQRYVLESSLPAEDPLGRSVREPPPSSLFPWAFRTRNKRRRGGPCRRRSPGFDSRGMENRRIL